MRDSGKASKTAIRGVIRDINDYTAIVQNELDLIMQEAESLSDVWKDDKFRQFLECVERLKFSVENELHAIDSTRRELEKKVGMM